MSDGSPSFGDAATPFLRLNWLKGMYLANVLVALPLGLASLLAPEAVQGWMGIPTFDPIHFGIASGAIPFAFGIAGVMGLRFPVSLYPVLALQALYKSAFLLAVAVPLLVRGQFPEFAVPLCIIYLLFIVGNVIAVPFSHLFSQPFPAR